MVAAQGQRKIRAAIVIAVAVGSLMSAALAHARDVYVSNRNDDFLTKIDTATNTASAIPTGIDAGTEDLLGLAITPDGAEVWLAVPKGVVDPGKVVRYDVATGAFAGTAIPVGLDPRRVAITPDGSRAYVSNRFSHTVSVIDTTTNAVVGGPIDVDVANSGNAGPEPLAITPDGSTVIVGNSFDDTITFINTADNSTTGLPADATRQFPISIAVDPDGSHAWVVNRDGDGANGSISVINLATKTYEGPPIVLPGKWESIAVPPSGTRAYIGGYTGVTDLRSFDLATNEIGGAIPMGSTLVQGSAFTPDGSRLYIAVGGNNTVQILDTQTDTTFGSPLTVGADPFSVAIVPNQGPTAGFNVFENAAAKATAGSPTTFDTGSATDPDGTVTSFAWDFGDGTIETTGANPKHTYAAPGTYTVTLTVTDNEGCSTALVYTGQTASCVGTAAATTTKQVEVSDAALKLKLKGKKSQRVEDKVKFKAVASDKSNLVARGVLKLGKKSKVKLGKVKAKLQAGKAKKLAFKLNKAAQKALKRAGKGTVQIKATAKTKDGVRAKAKRAIKVKPK